MSPSEPDNQHSCPQPSVSVVIPLYNKGPYIARTLSSIFKQAYPPLEIIIVDDCSTDDGPEKVLACNDPRIRLVKNPVNLGPGATRNKGLALAGGRYIAFLDADDEWHPDFLQTTVSYLEEHPSAALVATGYIWYPPRKSNRSKFADLKGEYEIGASTPLILLSAIESFIHPVFTVVRTDVARRWGGYYERNRCLRGEDQYFLLKLLFNERIFIIPESHGVYHTEASALFGRMLQPVPTLEPSLSDPADLIESCPPSKRELLELYLTDKALDRAMLLIKLGQRPLAMELVRKLAKRRGRFGKRGIIIMAIACIAPLLPPIRAIWHRIRDLTSHVGYLNQLQKWFLSLHNRC